MVTLDSIHDEVKQRYGSCGLKITRTSEHVYVDTDDFFIQMSVGANSNSVCVTVGWEYQFDSVHTEAKHCRLDSIVFTVNRLCTKLVKQVSKLIQEVPSDETTTLCNVDPGFDPSGVSLPIG